MGEISFSEGAEFIGALVKAGLTPNQAKSVASSPQKAEDIIALLRGNATLCFSELPAAIPNAAPKSRTISLAQAKAIMQQNYHDPAQWASKCKFRLSIVHKEIFASVPLDESSLMDNANKLLIPILPLSIMQLHTKYNDLFRSIAEPWYSTEAFANEKPEAGWMLFGHEIVPGSTSKTFVQQEAMLSEGESVPTAAELAQANTCHAVLNGERLLPAIYARTTSVNFDGRRVDLRGFGESGLDVSSWNDNADSETGAVSARKL